MQRSASLVDQLGNVTDPRRGEPVYPLVNILFMMTCGAIAGADDFVAIARFSNTKKAWFAKLLDMSDRTKSMGYANSSAKAILAMSCTSTEIFSAGLSQLPFAGVYGEGEQIMSNLQDKAALVTGASKEIGAGIVAVHGV